MSQKTNSQAKRSSAAARKIKKILDAPPMYSAAELIALGWPQEGEEFSPNELQLIREAANRLLSMDHDYLAHLAAGASLRSLKFQGIFANTVHLAHHQEKSFSVQSAVQRHTINLQEKKILEGPQTFAGERARAGASARLRNDPKQVAKAEAYALWLERLEKKHPKLKSDEQFAMEVLRRWPVLTSVKVICGWCTEWKKQLKPQSAS